MVSSLPATRADPLASMPALHARTMALAERGEARELCAGACLVEQLLGDVAACAEAEATVDPMLADVRDVCRHLASAVLSQRSLSSDDAATCAALLRSALVLAVTETGRMRARPQGRLGPTATELLRHAADWKTPECFGYDVCEPLAVRSDVATWQLRNGGAGPPLVVGVRTGGSYLAPIWAADTRTTLPYVTLRPLRIDGRIVFADRELARLPVALPSGARIVVVDDQPDTGATVRAVHDMLTTRYPHARDVTVTSPGRLFVVHEKKLRAITDRLPVRRSAHLWQLLDRGNHRRLISRAAACGVPLGEADEWAVEPFHGRFVSRYQMGESFVPWSDPSFAAASPRRIDPRRTPISVRSRRDPTALYHFRFVGTGPHGAWCADGLEQFGSYLPAERYFCDGYVVTRHEPDLTDLADHLADRWDKLRTPVLAYWQTLAAHNAVGSIDPRTRYDLRGRVRDAAGRLGQQIGRRLPLDDRWLERYVPDACSVGGGSGRLLRTSLAYSHHWWHWQVGTRDGSPTVRRFGIDWIWGGTGCLESEIASFAVEHRLSAGRIRELADGLNGAVDAEDVHRRLGEGILWNLKTWRRRCRVMSPGAADRVEQDLADLAGYVAATTG
jgi:neamine phosphoribosyltransferase